jgi:hypothetical protein
MGTEDAFSGSIDRVLGWKEGFQTIAVRRLRPLLLRAGVPEVIARSPDQAADRAIAFLLALRDLRAKPDSDEVYYAGVELLLRRTFAELTTALGSDVTEQLRDWLTRNFADHDERMRLWIWSTLLPRLAAAYGHSPKHPSPLPDQRTEQFNRIVRSYFSSDIGRLDDELEERVRLEPLNLLEREVLAIEQAGTGESDEAPDVQSLMEAAGNERARKAWSGINEVFTPRERTILVTWARQEGAFRKMPLDLIVVRSAEL